MKDLPFIDELSIARVHYQGGKSIDILIMS